MTTNEIVKHPIEELGKIGINNTYILMWSEGEYDEYQVYFTPIKGVPDKFLKDFPTDERTPLCLFYVQGSAKVPIPYLKVTRWHTTDR